MAMLTCRYFDGDVLSSHRQWRESGIRDEPAVDLWLKLGEEDPLPEARYAMASLDENGEAGPLAMTHALELKVA